MRWNGLEGPRAAVGVRYPVGVPAELSATDAYVRSCEATVQRVTDGGVVLDRTVFYARGGGHPGVTGVLRWAGGETRVVDTVKEGGSPLHQVEGVPLPVGAAVTAEIEIQEGDIAYLKVGNEVRVRAVSFAVEREFNGKVTLIDRNVTPKSTGNVIKVQASIDNPQGLLRTGMAGRAKVLGESMPVWKAFTMAIVRFVQVQVWSWIP